MQSFPLLLNFISAELNANSKQCIHLASHDSLGLYIYIYIERERERERESYWESILYEVLILYLLGKYCFISYNIFLQHFQMMCKCYFLKKEKKKGSYFCWCCIINMENIWELFIDMEYIEYIGEYCLFLIEC